MLMLLTMVVAVALADVAIVLLSWWHGLKADWKGIAFSNIVALVIFGCAATAAWCLE